jgi:hypothetical protein
MSRNRRIVAAICLAAVFLAAIVPAASALFCAVLVPLPALFGTVLVSRSPAPESVSPEPFPPRSPLPSRAPPAA